MKISKVLSIIALVLILSVSAFGCSTPTSTTNSTTVSTTMTTSTAAEVQPTETNPIVIDPVNREIRIAAQVNGTAFTQPTWHAVVYSGGSAAGASLFQAFVPPAIMYDAITYFGGVPGNNMTNANMNNTYVQGSDISITVTWNGTTKTYNLSEVVKDPNATKGLNIKFGGNLATNESAGTGCITCFYSCPIGITSNSSQNATDMAAETPAGFLGDSSVLPPNGTIVVLTYKVTS